MATIILYSIAFVALIISLIKNRSKTGRGAKSSKNMLINTFPQILAVMAIIGLVLALVPPESIK